MKLGSVLSPCVKHGCSKAARIDGRGKASLLGGHCPAVEDGISLAGSLAAEEEHVVGGGLVGLGLKGSDELSCVSVQFERGAQVGFRLVRFCSGYSNFKFSSVAAHNFTNAYLVKQEMQKNYFANRFRFHFILFCALSIARLPIKK
jgi:hypothetical protein